MKTKSNVSLWEHLEDFSRSVRLTRTLSLAGSLALAAGLTASCATAQPTASASSGGKRPNVIMLMQDDTGWFDFGCYGGGRSLGHPTPNVDKMAAEGARFTSWYGQASCTAGRCSFMTGRIPIRSAMSVVVVPGDPNILRKETPTIAEYFQKNGYMTYFSGKWHLGDVPEAYPIEHGFDEMKDFFAYYPGVYTYSDTTTWFHPWFPQYNEAFSNMYFKVVNMYAWEGVAGQPAKKVGYVDWNYLATADVQQTDHAIEYIKQHVNDDKPFFMDVNFMKMHNPNNPAPKFAGKSHLGRYSDSMLELDDNIGRIMDTVRQLCPNTIVITTADNGAWQDAWPDAGTHPFRGDKGTPFEAGWRVPGIMWWPGHIPAGAVYDEMMTHIDCWATLATLVGLTPPPHGAWVGNDGKPIYFDSIDNSAYVLGKARHSARRSWIYINGEALGGVRADVAGDPGTPEEDLNIAWKSLFTSKDTWLGPTQNSGGAPTLYCLTLDPFEKCDMLFNGGMASRLPKTSPAQWGGMDNGWALSLTQMALGEFDKSINDFPNIKRFPGGASTDMIPNLQNPENPTPYMDFKKAVQQSVQMSD